MKNLLHTCPDTLVGSISLLFIFSFSHSAYSQNPDIKRTYHWYFGNGAGIDFSSGTAVADTTGKLHTYEGCATISDTAGNLLFYTDGDTVWNKNHQPMPNGTGLMGCGNKGSSTQAALIVPLPNNPDLYYIFTTDCMENSWVGGFRYSVVDMTLDGGLGDIISSSKNILIRQYTTEQLAATKHANGIDYWIVCRWDTFYSYLLTPLGFDTNPIKSLPAYYGGYGQFKFSPDGNKAVIVADAPPTGWPTIFNFNNGTGQLSQPIKIFRTMNYWGNGWSGAYGGSFSPDNSKLYISDITGDYYSKIYQYDISVHDSIAIANSMSKIDSIKPPAVFGSIQMSPDFKLVIARPRNAPFYPNSVGIINNPNLSGIACTYVDSGLYLMGRTGMTGLPNFIDSWFWDSTMVSVAETENDSEGLRIFPNPFHEFTIVEIPLSAPFSSDKLSLSAYDVLGRNIKLSYSMLTGNISTLVIKLYEGNLTNGIYLLHIQNGNYLYKQKLIIN